MSAEQLDPTPDHECLIMSAEQLDTADNALRMLADRVQSNSLLRPEQAAMMRL